MSERREDTQQRVEQVKQLHTNLRKVEEELLRTHRLTTWFTLMVTILASVVGGAVTFSSLLQALAPLNTINKFWGLFGGLFLGALFGLLAAYGSKAVRDKKLLQAKLKDVSIRLHLEQKAILDDFVKKIESNKPEHQVERKE